MTAWLTADEINARVDDVIATMGDAAFPHNGRAHLYSGPGWKVQNNIPDFVGNNHARAKRRSKLQNALLIDDTAIGQYLETFEGLGVYEYFNRHPTIDDKLRNPEADKVWRHASRRFVSSLWGKVYTTVCGADRHRVYYQEEIPTFSETIPAMIAALIKSQDIEAINDVPIKRFRALYKPADYDDVQRLVSLSEIRLDLRSAWRLGSTEIFGDYLTGQEQYRVDRNVVLKDERPIYNADPVTRQKRKKELLREFVAGFALPSTGLVATPTPPSSGTHPAPVAASSAHLA